MAIIYKITNKVNGKIYIGFTDGTLEKRWKTHCKNSYRKKSRSRLVSAIRKYGKDSFTIETLHEEPDSNHALNVLEPYYIAKFDSTNPDIGYNMTCGGEGAKHSEEVYRKIGDAVRGEKHWMFGKGYLIAGDKNPMFGKGYLIAGDKNPMFGKVSLRKGWKLSEETKEKQRKAKIGYVPWNKGKKTGPTGRPAWNKGKKMSEETCHKLRGKKAWNKGKTGVYSAEAIQKMREARRSRK